LGWTFLTNVVDKTPTTTGAWVDVDVSANVPSGTKAVLLKIVNTSASDYVYGIRPVGSSVTRTGYIDSFEHLSWAIAIVKLDASYKFQAYINNTAVKIYLWGYTDEDICFVNPYNKSTTTINAWVDVSNTELPNGSKGAIYERVNAQTSIQAFGLRPKGSTADIKPEIVNQSHAWALIGIDTNKYSQQYIGNTLCGLYLWGRAGSDFVSFTNPYNITPTTTGSYVTVDLSSYIPDGAYGICGLMFNITNYACIGDIRKYGSSDNHSAYSYVYNFYGKFFIVGCSSNRKVDIYISDTGLKVYLWGYFFPTIQYINISDSATGSDIVGITGQIPLTDVGSGTDVVSIVGYIEKTDTGVGTDIIDILGQIPISDTGLGSETILVSKELIVGDTSVGTDTINVVGNIPILDYGSGSEVIQTQSMVDISDYGTGVDLPSINVPLQISDYGTGADTINVGINIPIEDYCVGSEVIDIVFGITIEDYCIGSDVIEISTLIPVSDYCVGNDIIEILASVPISDYGIGNEVVDVKGYINITDYSLGSEIINIATPINISDYGTGTDVVGIVSGVYITDAGFGVDLVSSWMGANIYDFGKGIDTIDVGLGIVGNVLIDGNNIGEFSYVYKDLYSENLPVQVVRRRLEGDVVIDGEKIGFSQFEWEDRITMEVEGYRTIRIKGLVKLSDVI
jgi:hypothetical protein